MRFKGLDLNLLGAFVLLMQERSVSGAARQLNLSQPAMSAALARMREFFQDDILVMQGKRMYPTAFAEALYPKVRESLRGIETLIMTPSEFVPATAERTFRLIASDYMIAVLIVPLVARLATEAPGIRLELAAPDDESEAQIADGKADLLISPENFMMGDQPSELLFEESHVVVGWSSNPMMASAMTEEVLLAAGHVGVRIGSARAPAFADRQMGIMSKTRRIEVETSSFMTIPLLLNGTNRLALIQERLARLVCSIYPLSWTALPFEFPQMREIVKYHRSRSNDGGLIWLRQQLHAISKTQA